jgi:MFS family permease
MQMGKNQESLSATHSDEMSDVSVLSTNASDSKLRVGTLQYTKMGLVTLFVWLLWGDFCFTLMEQVIPSILPLKLQSLKAPNWLLGLIVTTIPSIMNLLVNPTISFRSDRYRSRWGRRIPFLLMATPFVTLSLIAMGYSDEIGLFLYTSVISHFVRISPTASMLFVIALLMICFQFFNMFISTVYYYLFNDVVPSTYLARCMALFQVLGAAGSTAYNFFMFPYAKTHMRAIFIAAAVVYFVGFMLMCLKVKEGQYPPPPQNVGGKKGIWAAAQTYCLECYTHRFYWDFFLMNSFVQLSSCVNAFNLLYILSLGVTLKQLGYIGGVAGIVSLVLLYPAGMLSDKFHPVRIMYVALVGRLLGAAFGFIYLFYDFTPNTVFIITCISTAIFLPIGVIYAASGLPLYMLILPKERYGQFGSADAIVRSIFTIAGGIVAGTFLDIMKKIYSGDDYYYRFVPCWQATCFLIALFFMYRVYRGWKTHGGHENYVPPRAEH